MQTGIIGLPQVGKSTLFRILTKAHVDPAKGGQETRVGVANVPEPRLVELAKLYNPKKTRYATVQYVDLGGIQKEGLRELELTPEERKPIGGFLFLSQRPMLFVLNLGDDEAGELETAVERHKLGALQGRTNTAVVAVCGRLEAELAEMNDAEAAELLASYGLKEPGLNRLIGATYDLMGLTSFFTAGEPEVRAWTIHKNTNAVKAAGAIHSDIEKGFIRAEVVRWDDLVAAGSLSAAREKAQVRREREGYIGQESDGTRL